MQANEEFARSCANYSLHKGSSNRQASGAPRLASLDERDTLIRRGFAEPVTTRQ